jgi:hypothetical protein
MTEILSHKYPTPVRVCMNTTSGSNREAGTRAEIRNIQAKDSGGLLGPNMLTGDEYIRGTINVNGSPRDITFNVQRVTPYKATAITLIGENLEGLPMPRLKENVYWTFLAIKIFRE